MKNFSYKKNKKDFAKELNTTGIKAIKFKINSKRICVFFCIVMFIFISLFPITKVQATNIYDQKVTNGIDSFPESYQKLLKQFVDDTFHDNWNFQAYYTGIDWNDFINGESVHGRNRVYKGFDTAYRCSCNDLASGYYCANSEITSYFIDPRNFINERNIFQFLDVSYNEQIYTREIVTSLVSKYEVFNYGNPITFIMSDENHEKYNQEVTMTFTDIIMEAAKVSKMSPISMIIKIVQEVGSSGSASTDGKNATYPNTYNFFNVGSSDSGDAILNGLAYADQKGWHCPYTAIVEGAMFNSDNYIKAGQNTAYFYKFDCVGNKILNAGETQQITANDLYHQYMTNIQDPYSQSASLFSTYTNNGLLTQNLNFIIPIFNNMPTEAVDKISTLSKTDQNLYYANISSSLIIRQAPDGNVIKTIYKDDLVIMLQRNYNSVWDKIQLWDGQIGYTKSEYLEPYVPNNSGNSNTGGTGGETLPTEDENEDLDLTPIPNIGYGYADVSSTLNVRKGPGTSYAIETTLSSKEEFLILEETSGWYKIRLRNGKIGYVSKDYVVQIEYIQIDEANKLVTIIPGITANIVAGKLNATEYQVTKSNVEILDNSLGTGYVIKIGDKEYTIIKAGDVNGDGKISPSDYIKIKNHIMGDSKLTDGFKSAADLNKDNDISPSDYIKIKNYIMETGTISL